MDGYEYGHMSDVSVLIKGEKSGTFKGSCVIKGKEDWITLAGWRFEVKSPRDAASGAATGRRQYLPLVLNKTLDRASSKLFGASVTNETLTSVRMVIRKKRNEGSGDTSDFFTIELENARIASLDILCEPNGAIREVVTLTFQKITLTYVDGGIAASDDWDTRGS
jgi:type VI secretion system secreted protein Hcp